MRDSANIFVIDAMLIDDLLFSPQMLFFDIKIRNLFCKISSLDQEKIGYNFFLHWPLEKLRVLHVTKKISMFIHLWLRPKRFL